MESIGRYCAAIYRLSQSIMGGRLKETGLGSGQYDFFLVIAKNEGISQKDLGEGCSLKNLRPRRPSNT